MDAVRWGLVLESGVNAGCQLGLQLQPSVSTTCDFFVYLGFWTAWQLGSKSKYSKRNPGGNCTAFYDLPLEVTKYHFCYTLLVEVVTKFHPGSRGRDADSTSQWEMTKSHCQRSMWEGRFCGGRLRVIQSATGCPLPQ